MSFPPLSISRHIDRLLPVIAWFLSLCFLAWSAATLFWRATTPATVPALAQHEADARKSGREILLSLGSAPSAPQAANAAPASAVQNYQLVAVATGFGTLPGFAILETPDGNSLSLTLGESTPDGLTLTRIAADHIELGQGRELRIRAAELPLPTPDLTPTQPGRGDQGDRG